MIDLVLWVGGIAVGVIALAGVAIIAFYAIWMSNGGH